MNRIKLVFGGGAGHDCKGCCVVCNPHHALELIAYYTLEGRIGTKKNKNGSIKKLPYKEIKIV